MACSSGCPTPGKHRTYGECLKDKGTRIGWAASISGGDRTTEKKWEKNLEDYRQARKEGIQPQTTRPQDILNARKISDKVGKAYNSTNGSFS